MKGVDHEFYEGLSEKYFSS